ncbi:AraC family transcriptional regulator [Paenibacillus sp. SYP-B3998]|uniref:AraC family transcriptional regulator n=2 Tax=Paenibacillus sp. SYP-B3998 TaxID=2678564 RepID=A0A6G3ZRR1_9BACL|nr:AraC family transcriptional regulator [Paenibacillus sp. SYP-B3998]
MKLSDPIMLWNHVFIKVMDVRHTIIEAEKELHAYRLPTSAFIYVVRGSAEVRLDGTVNIVKRFHILHGGKGLSLDIAAKEIFEYYMILYKAILPLPGRQELLRLMESDNPFQRQYGFAPLYPISLYEKVELIVKEWQQSDTLGQLHVKTLFYQFVYEVLGQLHQQGISTSKPDLVAQAIRYIHEHYREHVTLESLVEMLDCNSRQFLRLFKSQKNTSPIDYLIHVRMNKAKELLLNTSLTLKEIAESVGYSDSYYFSRIFKKYEGVAPTSFKENTHKMDGSRYSPSYLSNYPIVARKPRRYIVNEYDNHFQYRREGDLPMYRSSKTSMAVTLLFCFTLLLSACTTGTTNSSVLNGSSAVPSSNVATSAPTATQSLEVEAPRVIKHAMGVETLTGTPKRVVILTNEGTEALLAVGIKPIGAVQSWIGNPWYDHIKQEMQDVTVVGDELQPNIEMIASLKPDLIIGNKVRQEKIYEQLKQIAPTVFAKDLGGDWKDNFKLYMEAVNKKEEGEKAMAIFDKRVSDVKAKLGSKAATKVSIARFSATQVRIYQKQTFSGVLLSQLGFDRPASQNKDSFIEVMTKETIPSMDGDVLFYFVTEAAGKTDASKAVKEWMNDPLFKNLNVSKNNKVVQVDEAIWNTAGGYKAANLLLDELITYFEVK